MDIHLLKSGKKSMTFLKSVKELSYIEFYINNLDKLRGTKFKYLFEFKLLIQREMENWRWTRENNLKELWLTGVRFKIDSVLDYLLSKFFYGIISHCCVTEYYGAKNGDYLVRLNRNTSMNLRISVGLWTTFNSCRVHYPCLYLALTTY